MSIFGRPFHASHGRASVDALSNFVEFPEFNFEKDADSFLRNRLDPARVTLFLHEATHHWCFDSPVFYTLFILQIRALGGLWQIANDDPVDEFDVVDDIYRSRAVVDLYRPILEGLALFAEFVALPRDRFIYSHPFSQMIALCSGRFDENEDVHRNTWALLASARGSEDFVRKKAGLLSMPLEASRSPYFAGYMLVCSIWRSLLNQRIDLFTNTDAFLSYLRSYFFFDYELIAILMNNELHEWAIVHAVGQHLQRRIIRLVSSDLSILVALRRAEEEKGVTEDIFQKYSVASLKSAISTWDTNDLLALDPRRISLRTKDSWFRKAGITGLDRAFQPIKGILNDDTKTAETQKQLLGAYDWLLPNTKEDRHLSQIKQFAFAQIAERTKLVILQIPAQATIGGGRCVVTLSTGSITMDVARGAQPGVYDVRLELALSSRIVNPLAYVWADGKIIGTSLPPQFGSMLDDNDVATMRNGATFQETVQILNEVTDTSKLVADSLVPILIDSYEEGIAKQVDHVYETAFLALYGKNWSDVSDRMRERGLLGLEGASFAAIRGIAHLSQLSCFPISEAGRSKLVANIRADGDSPDPVDEAMRLFGPESRLPLMSRTDTHWLHWI